MRLRVFGVLCVVLWSIVAGVCALALTLPAAAGAYATAGAAPEAGSAGLPDGRVYEQVSPKNKFGNEVLAFEHPALVAASGQAVLYGTTGGVTANASNAAVQPTVVSERTSQGWVTRSAMPLPNVGTASEEENVTTGTLTTLLVPSADFSRLLFTTWDLEPYVGAPDEANLPNNVYLEGPNPLLEPEWIGRSQIAGEPGGSGGFFPALKIAGASPDLKTIYFFYENALLAGASGLYEYREGVLSNAGQLPSGETGAGFAAPAAQPTNQSHEQGLTSPAAFDNQVSADGSRIFFVRKDEAGTLELYAHLTAADGTQSTVLVSQSQLSGHAGEPASHGPNAMVSTASEAQSYESEYGGGESAHSYAFASPDGSHVLFQSVDRLTESAPESGSAKTYDFDLETGALEYLPGLVGSIVTVSDSGSSAVFENTSTSPFQLERWVAGANGGSVTPIVQLPSVTRNPCGAVLCVGPAYTSTNGSVVVFSTESAIAGFNDGGTHYARTQPLAEGGGEQPITNDGLFPNIEVFRYDAQSGELSCLSCPPAGVTPESDAIVSKLEQLFNGIGLTGGAEVITPGSAVSAEANRVFFETRDPLVQQDTNGVGDVYEWEEGKVYLISSGHSPESSYFAGASETGNDAFFMTSEGISQGDDDGSFDVYDARVPRPGDVLPPEAVPCTGSVCQGPPSVPQLLGAPSSETFNGLGNVTAKPGHPSSKSLTRAQKLTRALKACTHKQPARKRRACKRQAQAKYGKAGAAGKRAGKQADHRNGRGK
ncbi:MAG TPA: hypothetical protein VGF95_01505 [Solirubrobacteraceae bacterium]